MILAAFVEPEHYQEMAFYLLLKFFSCKNLQETISTYNATLLQHLIFSLGFDLQNITNKPFCSLPLDNNPPFCGTEVVLTGLLFFVEVFTLEEPAKVKCDVLNAQLHIYFLLFSLRLDSLNKHFWNSVHTVQCIFVWLLFFTTCRKQDLEFLKTFFI